MNKLSRSRQATIAHLDQIGNWIEVAAAWGSVYDSRRLVFELANLARVIVHHHNGVADVDDRIAFDDDEAIWVAEVLGALREFRPHSLPE